MHIRAPLVFVVLAAACTVIAWPQTVDACSPGYCFEGMTPKDGATSVPVDAHVRLSYSTVGSHPEDVELRVKETNDLVPTTTSVLPVGNQHEQVSSYITVVKPASDLSPDTTYQLSFGGRSTCHSPSPPSKSFTTGSHTADPVRLPDRFDASISCQTRPGPPNSCSVGSQYPVYRFSFDMTGDEDVFGYRLFHDGEVVALTDRGSPLVYHKLPRRTDPAEAFAVMAVNIAGESTSVIQGRFSTADVSCPPDPNDDPADAGDVGHRDTGPALDVTTYFDADSTDVAEPSPPDTAPSADTSPPPTKVEECGCRSTSPSSLGFRALVLLALLGLVRLRRISALA